MYLNPNLSNCSLAAAAAAAYTHLTPPGFALPEGYARQSIDREWVVQGKEGRGGGGQVGGLVVPPWRLLLPSMRVIGT